jgi:hypothetical protein
MSSQALKVEYQDDFPFNWSPHGGGGHFVGKVGCQTFRGIVGRPPYFVYPTNWNGYAFVSKVRDAASGKSETIFHVYSKSSRQVESISVGPLIFINPSNDAWLTMSHISNGVFEANIQLDLRRVNLSFDIINKKLIKDDR